MDAYCSPEGGAKQEELELVAAGGGETALSSSATARLQDPARVDGERLAVELDVGHADAGVRLPGQDLGVERSG